MEQQEQRRGTEEFFSMYLPGGPGRGGDETTLLFRILAHSPPHRWSAPLERYGKSGFAAPSLAICSTLKPCYL